MSRNSSLICAFWAFLFLKPSYHLINSLSLHSHRHHPIFLLALLSQTNQGHIPRRKGLPSLLYRIFLSFKTVRDIVQLPWVYLNPLNTHFLSFKTVRNKKKACRVDAHYLIAQLLRLKMPWDMFQ